jgi:hypothetical protein
MAWAGPLATLRFGRDDKSMAADHDTGFNVHVIECVECRRVSSANG